jgi:hypothetical protein
VGHGVQDHAVMQGFEKKLSRQDNEIETAADRWRYYLSVCRARNLFVQIFNSVIPAKA